MNVTDKCLIVDPFQPDLEAPEVKKPEPQIAAGLQRNAQYRGRLTEREMEKILANYPVYKKAADRAGIPWQMLAAVHFRESSLSTVTRPFGGPFQFTPPLRQGEERFEIGASLAASFLQNKSGGRLTSETTNPEIIKDAFWGYNGRAYGSAENSPYVMSHSDESHRNMRIRGTVLGRNGERIRVDTVDKRVGAYPYYLELMQAFREDKMKIPPRAFGYTVT